MMHHSLLTTHFPMNRLVIVESPTKAKTIKRMLGDAFDVVSSYGHIRDLPKSKIGVDTEHGYEPKYVIPPDKRKRVSELKAAASKANDVYIATDDDREGEAIAWHIAHVLKINPKTAKRIVFHEITKRAIDEAMSHPRSINLDLFQAQQARRVLDRLVGYTLSPFLWKKVARGLSAGRVQSVAMRFIVERERERQAFISEEYWSLDAVFVHANVPFDAKLKTYREKKVGKMDIKTDAEAHEMVAVLRSDTYRVASIETKEQTKQPKPPYKTSTLQQDANNKLHMSSKQTMRVAQQLYEGVALGKDGMTGLITYMRTDSLNMADVFVSEAHEFIEGAFGQAYRADKPRHFKTNAKGAQEAHEAIRPTSAARTPDSVRVHLDPTQFKLYDLIWRRAVATQMAPAKLRKQGVDLVGEHGTFRASGNVIVFDGYMKLYPDASKETLLPELKEHDPVALSNLTPTQHFTEPPARYSDATLVKTLEENGIGRPSTYAPTISTIIDRGYVERDDNKKLFPTDIAFVVNDLLVEHFPNIVDKDFTATMEADLDRVEEGARDWVPLVRDFFEPLQERITQKEQEVNKKELTEEKTDELCEKCQSPMVIKLGRFGKFMACSNYPECKHTIALNKDGTKQALQEPKVLGTDAATQKAVTLRTGRFGPYVQLGEEEEVDGKKQKLKRASLLRGMAPDDVTLEIASSLLSLPRTLGTYQDSEVTAHVGRFGPYIACDEESRSIPAKADFTVLDITLEQAIELLKKPKRSRHKRANVK
ncbi:DNA topoisomerase I [Candidatus Uhrbacteria bacterium RIFCSPHIGHO2_02_FULL_53_13]|uniref:DNA topoisomerase 1 n=3 Tax=Candidatus Uhriibacteriota TaxID=1752732 RepID=A0A1F7U0F4_9BACT|nr:MAG: DNA topoisomerase I [Candidatus Uhrbacteria bacterium RIFCSPHIGHO2_02_FULL_53_13]OGL89069.1 MAG: DNA topoisomerase I [Candidatus Uhrbacteria bacterium RIFCSPLOWO2_02_FULL_53_10]